MKTHTAPWRAGALAAIAAGLAGQAVAPVHAQAADAPLDPEQLFARLSPSVWMVAVKLNDGKGASGSGVVVAPQRVITNCHVVDQAARIEILKEQVVHVATVEHSDRRRDLCLLHVPRLDAPSVPIGDTTTLRVGQRVFALGSPIGLELTFSDGMVSSLRRGKGESVPFVQTTTPISPGSSGGGLFDLHGRLIGITTFKMRGGENINFAVPANWVSQIPAVARAMASAAPALASIPAPAPSSASASAPAPAQAQAPTPPPAVAAHAAAEPPPALPPSAQPQWPVVGEAWVYRLDDRAVPGNSREVTYRVDTVNERQVVYNGGARVEDHDGVLLSSAGPIGGAADSSAPPGGWAHRLVGSPARQLRYTADGKVYRLDATERARQTLQLGAGRFEARRFDLDGWVTLTNINGLITTEARCRGEVWLDAQTYRLLRFKLRIHAATAASAFDGSDETLELVRHERPASAAE